MSAVVDIDALITRLRSRASGWYEDLMLEAADALEAMRAETAAITELRGANAEIDMLRHDLAAERARADRLAARLDETEAERARLFDDSVKILRAEAEQRVRADRLATGGDQLAEVLKAFGTVWRVNHSNRDAVQKADSALASWRALRSADEEGRSDG